MRTRMPQLVGPVLWGAALAGCSWAPAARVTSLEAENRRLDEQSRAQLVELSNLQAHSRYVEDRLVQAEHRLARLASAPKKEAQPFSTSNAVPATSGNVASKPSGGSLAVLAERYPDLFQYDGQSVVSRVDTPILFDSENKGLNPETEQLLGELAQILQSPMAADLKVHIVGRPGNQEVPSNGEPNARLGSDRAQAVADRLRALGIRSDRLQIAEIGAGEALLGKMAPQVRRPGSQVDLFLTSPEVPQLGAADTQPSRR